MALLIKNSESQSLNTSGGTMTGPLILSGDPTSDLQAATKKYVDDLIGDIQTVISDINDLIGGDV